MRCANGIKSTLQNAGRNALRVRVSKEQKHKLTLPVLSSEMGLVAGALEHEECFQNCFMGRIYKDP